MKSETQNEDVRPLPKIMHFVELMGGLPLRLLIKIFSVCVTDSENLRGARAKLFLPYFNTAALSKKNLGGDVTQTENIFY